MGNKIFIDGRDFTEFADLDEITIQYGLDEETRSYSYQTSEEIPLYDEAYEYIKKIFFKECNNKDRQAMVRLYIESCDLTIPTAINYEDVQICPTSCVANVTVTQRDNKCYEYMNKTVFWDKGFVGAYDPIFVAVAFDSGFAQKIIMFLFPIIAILLYTVTIIANAIAAICKVINAGLGVVNFLTFGLLSNGPSKREFAEAILKGSKADYPDADRDDDEIEILRLMNESACYETARRLYPDKDTKYWERLCDFMKRLKEDGDGVLSCPDFMSLSELACGLARWIGGTGWYYQVPLIKDVFEYQAKQCGLEFKSSVFQSYPYETAAVFMAEQGGAVRKEDQPLYRPQDNWSTDTVIQLGDRIAEHFGLDFWIRDGVVYIDHFETFQASLPEFAYSIDEMVDKEIIEGDMCIDYIVGESCAFYRAEYIDDPMDYVSSKALIKKKYHTIVDWNEENADWKRDECKVDSTFSRARFMFDIITANKTGLGDLDLNIDLFRMGRYRESIQSIFTGLIAGGGVVVGGGAGFSAVVGASFLVDMLVNCEDQRDRDLIISGEVINNAKILILDPSSLQNERDDAKVIRREITEREDPDVNIPFHTFYDYNYPMYFDENYPEPELYQNFHYSKDPNLFRRKIYSIQEIELAVECDNVGCDIVKFIQEHPEGFHVRSDGKYLPRSVFGIPTETEIKFSNKNMYVTLKDIQFSCH